MDPQSDTFTTLVHALQEALPSPIPPSTSPIARPGNFSGEAAACSGFLLQCSLYLEMQPQLFPTERSKIAFIISLLSGRALQWAEALWNADSPQVNSLESFVEHFREVFSLSTTKVSVHDELLQLQQADSSIHEYTLRFRTLAASSGWNDSALLSVFRRGLNATVRRHMSIYEDTVGLESFLLKASRISQHLIACHSEPVIPAAISSRQAQPPPEPMVTDNYHLTPTERSRRIAQGLCLYCGSHGHILNTCPIRPPCPAVSTVHITPKFSSVPYINASLLYHDQSFPVKILVVYSWYFLGYILTPTGVQMDPKKIDAVRNWPRPTTVKELQRFLGFANFYRRFIAHYSQVAAPLTSLLKRKTHSISWAPEAEQAFHQLRSAFCTAPALIHPDPNLRFVVEVDAATLGVGAALSQWKGETPVLHPCAYFSRKLSPAEQNYDVGNRELLAIKLAQEEWRHWLEGAQYPFEVITDHKNLQYLRDAKRLNPRQARWALFFTRFNFIISYRPGNKNIKADALSRLHQPDPTPDEPEPILPSSVFLSPIQWALDDQIRAATLTEPAPPGGPEGKEYVPSTLRLTLLDSVHTSPGSGHPGSNRTLSLLQGRYWWPNMARDVGRYVKGCSVCAISSTPRKLPEGKLVPLPIPRRPWSHLGIDFATDLPPSDGYTTILVVVDRFSKWCKLIPLRGLPTALETAETLFQHVFRNFGLPEDIVSDRGSQFTSRVWRAFFRLLGVSVSLSSGYHPQTDGQTERKIQEIGRYLRAYCHNHQNSWNQYLPWAEYAQNSLRQSTTGLTPFQCILGFQPPLFHWTGERSEVPAVDYWFRESERVWDSSHVHLQQAVRRHKFYADARRSTNPVYQPGDHVWLSTRDIRLRLPSRKLSPRYIGPFPIIIRVNEVTYQLQLPDHYRISPTFHVSLLKPFTNPLLPSSSKHEVSPPPPEVEVSEAIYRVKEILDSRRRGGRIQYLIDWEGYGPEERSWADKDDILDPSLVSDFHQVHADRPAPRGRGRPRRRSRASGDARGGGG